MVFFVKRFYTAGSGMDALFSAVEGMALRTNFYADIVFGGGSGLEFVAASASHFYGMVVWVDPFFHPSHLFLYKISLLHITST